MSEEMARKVAALVRAGGVAIFSGAGLSTESGLQDFRSKDGIWAHADPTRLASVGVLENNYDEFLEFYKARLFVPDEVQPNVGHKLIAEWEKRARAIWPDFYDFVGGKEVIDMVLTAIAK